MDFPFTQGVNPPTQGGRAFAIRVCSMHDIDLELAVTEPAPGGFPIQLKNRDIMVLFKLVKVQGYSIENVFCIVTMTCRKFLLLAKGEVFKMFKIAYTVQFANANCRSFVQQKLKIVAYGYCCTVIRLKSVCEVLLRSVYLLMIYVVVNDILQTDTRLNSWK